MHYPDFPIQSINDFLRWYQGVQDNITWNSHDIEGLTIKGNQTTGWDVSYEVVWQAKAKNGERYNMQVAQTLKVVVQDNELKLAKLHAALI